MSNLEAYPDEVTSGDVVTAVAPVGTVPPVLPEHERPVDVGDGVTLLEPREVPLGGPRAMLVRRTLPHRDIRTIGAWCFVDHFGPTRGGPAMHVPPHPHIGLQTVTWLLAGDVEHRDSVGSRQLVHPGELNAMTAGEGIAHSEDTVGPIATDLHGVQLWTALPDADRRQEPHFEHHADLPVLRADGVTVTVFVGELDGARSAAAAYSPLLGAEVVLADGARVELPLEEDFEHGVLAVDGSPTAAGVRIPVSALVHLEPGRRSLVLEGPGRVLLLGGTPFGEDLLMWWNFVARSHEEIVAAREDWQAGRRFGVVDHPTARLPAPALPTTPLRARPNRRRQTWG
ncbi:MAG TPA: pirin family protein [Kineosporiaceae bacterium]|nr:pirin family protein [Kineosporiaceae bacterium]